MTAPARSWPRSNTSRCGTSERVDLEGLTVSVVTARTLYEMKRDTVRARDRADAERLRQRYGFEGE